MENKFSNIWNELHENYVQTNDIKYDNWLDEFEGILKNVDTEIIDLGCGVTGNSTRYLLNKGKKVISCDFAESALKEIDKIEGSKTLLFDLLNPFPFDTNSADVIVAELSLHYFRKKDTERIISEISRVLKPSGYLFLRLNSTHSTEYKQLKERGSKELEYHLFFNKNMERRFFSEEDLKAFFKDWKFICMKEENMNRWCADKIIWKCALRND